MIQQYSSGGVDCVSGMWMLYYITEGYHSTVTCPGGRRGVGVSKSPREFISVACHVARAMCSLPREPPAASL